MIGPRLVHPEPREGDEIAREAGTVSSCISNGSMTGTANQIEWAERIIRQVNAEFDRVATLLRSVACKQHDARRAETEAVICILEDKRADVMSRQQAGYFIRDWQEISDQVRQMIFRDARFQTIKSKGEERQ